MSRRKVAQVRDIVPEARYKSVVVAKLINCAMYDGRKLKAEKIVYEAIDHLGSTLKKDSVECFYEVIENLKPSVEVKSRRVGGATYQVPMEVRSSRSLSLALKWLLESAKKRKGEKTMVGKLSAELVDAYNKKGMAFKKKDDTHKMAEANKAFSHYRW